MKTIDRIKELLNKYGIRKDMITPETTIQSLKMASEDIDDFFYYFGKEFQIDGEGYNYYNYFLEQVHLGDVIENFVFRIFNPKKIKRKPLTIDHLIKVAENKKWFDL